MFRISMRHIGYHISAGGLAAAPADAALCAAMAGEESPGTAGQGAGQLPERATVWNAPQKRTAGSSEAQASEISVESSGKGETAR